MSQSTPPIDDAAAFGAGAVPAARWRSVVSAYVRMCKPRVIELLLVTSVPPMVLAYGAWPPARLLISVLVGGTLAAGGANTINSFIERDRDQHMARTRSRPLVTGEVAPNAGLWFGIVLNVIAFGVLTAGANLLAAALTLSATLFYVFVYTIWLKPRTAQNIVIGGAAGAIPALVGWAAVDNSLSAAPWILFLTVFLWTPAHFWALAMKYREDYARAGIPMLPVDASPRDSARHIAAYSFVTVLASLCLGIVEPMGPIYVVSAVALGLAFVGAALALVSDPNPTRAIKFFGLSNVYLSLLFAAVAVDALVR